MNNINLSSFKIIFSSLEWYNKILSKMMSLIKIVFFSDRSKLIRIQLDFPISYPLHSLPTKTNQFTIEINYDFSYFPIICLSVAFRWLESKNRPMLIQMHLPSFLRGLTLFWPWFHFPGKASIQALSKFLLILRQKPVRCCARVW